MDNEEIPEDAQHLKWEPIAQNSRTMAEVFEDENLTSGLNAGEWSVTFTEGTIKGRVLCSGLSGNDHDAEWGGNSSDWTATESAILSAPGEKKYCWCAGTDFGNSCHVASPSWVFNTDEGNADDCAIYCALNCAESVGYYPAFRRAVFGVTQ